MEFKKVLFFSLFLTFGFFSSAISATLFIYPSSGTFSVGKTFSVSIKVDSGGGVGINAAEAVLNFDPQYLQVNSVSKSGSIFTLWPVEPTFSNSKGEVSFAGGSPQAYTGNSGVIVSITFLAKKGGTTKVEFKSGSVLAADGKGTNVLSAMNSATFVLKEEGISPLPEEKEEKEKVPTGNLPPKPQVSSPTHPDPEKWYSNNNPEFTWQLPFEVIGVSFSLTKNPHSDPGSISQGLVDSKKYEKIEDGIWYFHIKFQNKYGWGPILHKKVLIDTTPPEIKEFSIKKEDPTDPKPILTFYATDTLSGIDYYQILVNDKEFATTTNIEEKIFPIGPLSPGKYKIELKAFDKAGNSKSEVKEIEIEPLKYPIFAVLISKEGEFFLQPPAIQKTPPKITTEDWLIIKGTSVYPEATVKVYLSREGKEPIVKETKTDSEGNWFLVFDQKLEKGKWQISAQIFDKRGAQSLETEKIPLKVVPPSFVKKYSTLILILLLIIIAILIFYNIQQKKKFEKKIEEIKEHLGKLKEKINRVFPALREEIREQIEVLDKRPGLSKNEKILYEKLKEALDISDAFLGEEVKEIESLFEEKEKKKK
jgi:cell division protein ZapA (FtsZ GTPase activity inhibitor)